MKRRLNGAETVHGSRLISASQSKWAFQLDNRTEKRSKQVPGENWLDLQHFPRNGANSSGNLKRPKNFDKDSDVSLLFTGRKHSGAFRRLWWSRTVRITDVRASPFVDAPRLVWKMIRISDSAVQHEAIRFPKSPSLLLTGGYKS